ncbi:MAG: ribonuclease III [Sideroxydans sp.]|nr:ribonuclease III [Sideroxydans sp.]
MKHAALCRQIGHDFSQPKLLQQALTHRSHNADHNERLEFLGDSVLNCTIAKHLFENYPDLPEGDLHRLRSSLVNQQTLAILAQQLQLGKCLLLSDGEIKSGGAERPSILADALEALFGAVWLDADFATAQQVILGLYIPFIARIDLRAVSKDAKTQLQELLQGRKLPLPKYSIVETHGKGQAQIFAVACDVEKLKISTRGEGSSRRIAEQIAAERAYQLIQNRT